MGNKNIKSNSTKELAIDFLHKLIECASENVSMTSKSEIIEYFLNSDFFTMSTKSFRLWKDIIANLSKYNQDLLIEFLNKLNITTNLFSRSNDNLKVKALRRLSFLIYSSPKDTYSNKLDLILEKIKDLISYFSNSVLVEIEIFLLIRVMFLKFTHVNLVEMLRHLWPIIFNELINILDKKKQTYSNHLTFASIKLIELLSLANMDEFCLYQWAFIFDFYHKNIIEKLNVVGEQKNFKPYIERIIANIKNLKGGKIEESKFDDYEIRGLFIDSLYPKSDYNIPQLINDLTDFIVLMNNFRGQINWNSIENVIETDFLNDIVIT